MPENEQGTEIGSTRKMVLVPRVDIYHNDKLRYISLEPNSKVFIADSKKFDRLVERIGKEVFGNAYSVVNQEPLRTQGGMDWNGWEYFGAKDGSKVLNHARQVAQKIGLPLLFGYNVNNTIEVSLEDTMETLTDKLESEK